MKNLSIYTYFMVTAKMSFLGFRFHKEIGSYSEEWINPTTGKRFMIKTSGGYILKEEFLSILAQAEISLEEFVIM